MVSRMSMGVAGVAVVGALATGCSDRTIEPARPTFDWGYPEYSQYQDGEHVGKTLYQTDPKCVKRLDFYECELIDAETPDDPKTNPTGASTEMTGGLDSCTAAIEAEAPSYCIPADVCNPKMQRPAWAPGQASTDNLAWQLFIALNWPANPDEPGYPDPSRDLGAVDADGAQHAKAVWLDYPTPEALFGVPSPCGGPTLTMSSKISRALRSKAERRGLPGDVVESTGGILVDQEGGLIRFDIRVNRTEWEFIVNQNDYWMTGASLAPLAPNITRDYQVPPGQTPGSYPAALLTQGDVPGDVGSMEVKVAWKPLSDGEAASHAYYTRTFEVYDPDAPSESQCTPQTFGLIGMHIIYMPALFGNPEWVWATFEHRDNVPTAGINDGSTKFSLYDPTCAPVKTPEECAAYVAGRDDPAAFRCCPNLELYPEATNLPDHGSPVPNQVTRGTNPTVSTILPTNCTDHYTGAITKFFGADNVWKNYFLVSAQWPLRGASTNFPPYSTGIVANFPCTLRNTTMETFLTSGSAPTATGCDGDGDASFCRWCNGDCVQTQAEQETACPGGAEMPDMFSASDCMGCHSMYAGQNSSFVLSHRPCCVRADGGQPNTCGLIDEDGTCRGASGCTWVASDPSCQSGMG